MRIKKITLFSLGLLIGSLLVGSWLPSLTPVYAQSIVLDGQGDDWGSQWQLITDELDVSVTSDQACGGGAGGLHPHSAPCFARTGYDIRGLWGFYQANNWYFRLDVDGVVGDADSVQGMPETLGPLGFGTHDDDGGWLTSPATDLLGLSDFEQYSLLLGTAGTLNQNATLSNVGGPGGLITLGGASTLSGEAIYGTTVDPGIIEWRIAQNDLLPTGVVQPQLWAGATAGVNNDQVSDDAIAAFLVLGIDITNVCPSPQVDVGQNGTFPIGYVIDGASTYPQASEVTITAPVPAGTTYVSCSGGLSCAQSGGVISWDLGTLSAGAAGTVSFVARFDVGTGITTDAYITIGEGLRDETRASGCVAVQPTPTPPPPPPPPPPTQPPPTSPPPPPTTATPPFVLPPSGQPTTSLPWGGWLLLASLALLGVVWGVTRHSR